MKRTPILLFMLSCVLLYISDLFAGALIALALIYQLNLLFNQIALTKQSQFAALKLFLFSTPLFFFLGAIHSFVALYFNESRWLYFLFALIITFLLFFLVNFFCFFVFNFLLAGDFKISTTYQTAFNEIKNAKRSLFKQTSFLLIFSFIPLLTTEWKIIFSITVYQVYYYRSQLRLAFGF